jgi:drug/metabolite transporter (DMT)-like permease
MAAFGRNRNKLLAITGLLLLCLLWAVDSVRADLFPSAVAHALPRFERQALQFGLLAIGAAVFASVRKAMRPHGRMLGECTLVGLGLFVVPALLLHVSREWISDLPRVALFSLAPVFAVVFEPHIGRGLEMSRSAMMAALVAVVGTLCVFPVDVPGSVAAGGAFCAVIAAAAFVAAANCRAVFLATELPGQSLAPMITITSGAAAAGFALVSAITEHAIWSWNVLRPELAWTAAIEWPALLLLFWLMRRMSAVRMTTRFLIAPLITNLVGLIVLRPTVSLRAGLGLLFVAIGAGWLLLASENEPQQDSETQMLHLG